MSDAITVAEVEAILSARDEMTDVINTVMDSASSLDASLNGLGTYTIDDSPILDTGTALLGAEGDAEGLQMSLDGIVANVDDTAIVDASAAVADLEAGTGGLDAALTATSDVDTSSIVDATASADELVAAGDAMSGALQATSEVDSSSMDAAAGAADTVTAAGESMSGSLENASGASNDLAGGLGNAVNMMVGMAGGQELFAVFNDAVGAVSEGVFGLNSTLEQASIMFGVMEGSTAKGDAALQHMIDFANGNPFPLTQWLGAKEILDKINGAGFATDAVLTRVGDAAAASGSQVGDLAPAFARIYGAMDNGLPISRYLLQLMKAGVITPQATKVLKDMEAAHASGADMTRVFNDSLARTSGSMQKEQGTWQGEITKFKDAIEIASSKAFKPFFEQIKAGMEGVSKWMNSTEGQQAMQKLGDTVIKAGAAFTEFVKAVVPVIKALVPFLPLLGTLAVLLVGLKVGGIVTGLFELGSAFMEATKVAGLFQAVIALAGGPITLIIIGVLLLAAAFIWAYNNVKPFHDAVNALIGFLVQIPGHFGQFISGIGRAMGGIGDAIGGFVRAVTGGIGGVIEWIKTHWILILAIFLGPLGLIIGLVITHFDQIKAVVATAIGVIGSILAAIWEPLRIAIIILVFIVTGIVALFLDLSAKIQALVTGMINAVVGFFVGFIVKVMTPVIEFAAKLIGLYVGLWTFIITSVINFVAAVVGFMVGFVTKIVGIVTPFVEQIVGFFVGLWNRVTGAVSAGIAAVVGFFAPLVGRVLGAIGNFAAALGNLASGAFNAFMGAAQSAWNGVTKWAGGLIGSLLNAMGNIASEAAKWGGSIIGGIINGISGAAGKLVQAIHDYVINKIPQPIRDALGIHSDSTVMAEIGRNVMGGLTNEILAHGTDVSAAMTVIAGNVAKPIAAPALLGGSASGSSAGSSQAAASQGGTNDSNGRLLRAIEKSEEHLQEMRRALTGQGGLSGAQAGARLG